MKKKLVMMLLSLICIAATAQEIRTHLVVWSKDGTQVAYALSEQPQLNFTDSTMVIHTALMEISYPLDQMAKMSYEKREDMAIRDINTDEPMFLFSEESLLFLNLQPNSFVGLYTASGQMIFSRTITTYGEYAFPVSRLSHGMYIVQVNGLTYKIAR